MKTRLLILLSMTVAMSACASVVKIKVAPAADITIESTPERINRGAYLVDHVAVCIDCHSQRDYTRYAIPIIPGTEGGGGERFGPEQGLPGTIYSRNISPVGIGHWSDGELLRTITTGATPDGRALFPIMPYMNYAQLTREDAYSIITFIRGLKPNDNTVPDRKLNFPLPLIVRTMPKEAHLLESVDMGNPVEYGKYLATIASCSNCHTPQDSKGRPVMELFMAGGFEFVLKSGGIVRASNITPDMETGLGQSSRENFIGRFKAFDNEESRNIEIPADEQDENTVMPWLYYSGMSEDDLGAIYDYLSTVRPVANKVIKHTDRDGEDVLN